MTGPTGTTTLGHIRGRAAREAARRASCVLAAGALALGAVGAASAPSAAASTPDPSLSASGTTAGTSVGSLRLPVPADRSRVVVVAPNGSDSATGTEQRPVRTLAKAVQLVPAGGTVVLREGSYHEAVKTPYGKELHIQNWPGETVWLDGAREVSGFVADGGAWRLDGWSFAPDATDSTGLMTTPEHPAARYPEVVTRNGVQLTQVLSRSAVTRGTFYVDRGAKRLWVGDDPAGSEIAAADREVGLFVNRGSGSSVRGIGLRRYATPLKGIAALVVAYAADAEVSDVVVEDSAMAGVSFVGSPRGDVLRSSLVRNGQLGVHANESDGFRVESSRVVDNNYERFAVNHAAGGVKVTASRPVVVSENEVSGNRGSGVWMDRSVVDVVAVANRLSANERHGFVFEISAGLVFAGNVVEDNGDAGLRILEAGHVEAWHNAFRRNRRNVDLLDGGRVSLEQPSHRGHDFRYPVDDPYMTWEIEDVTVRGNIIEGGQAEGKQLLGYDDARKQVDARDNGVTSDANGYWRPSASFPRWTAAWGTYPSGMTVATTLAELTTKTGLERTSVEVVGGSPEAARDRYPSGGGLPYAVAKALGYAAGASLPAGPPVRSSSTPEPVTEAPVAPEPSEPEPAPEPEAGAPEPEAGGGGGAAPAPDGEPAPDGGAAPLPGAEPAPGVPVVDEPRLSGRAKPRRVRSKAGG